LLLSHSSQKSGHFSQFPEEFLKNEGRHEKIEVELQVKPKSEQSFQELEER
jgi:hypothetical protein